MAALVEGFIGGMLGRPALANVDIPEGAVQADFKGAVAEGAVKAPVTVNTGGLLVVAAVLIMSLNQLFLMIFAVVATSGIVPALILLALLGGGGYYAWMAIRPTVVAQLDAAMIDVPPEIRRLLGMDAPVAGRASASSVKQICEGNGTKKQLDDAAQALKDASASVTSGGDHVPPAADACSPDSHNKIADTPAPSTDLALLLAIFPSLAGVTKTSAHVPGITFDADRHITAINLAFRGLSGLLHADLGKLTRLESLDLHGNRLTGSIPKSIGRLVHLRHLNLSENALDGLLPAAAFGNLTNLVTLNLALNNLTGDIPPSLASLTHLEERDLSYNRLTGTLDESLASLTCLKSLDVSHNQLHGPVPSGFANLDQLSYLGLRFNHSIDRVPAVLACNTRLVM
ncbi:hypothetical protein BC831DRAFT_473540 [Entophlyctis helioformis]|nr:hypothetical protein BC831DRAFT_473540 [Entophlyctis helioformis]